MAETGAILLGVLGCGVAVFAVDYAMSEPGESWLDQIKAKFESHPEPSKGNEHRRAPTPKRIAPSPSRRALPQRTPQTHQSFVQTQSSQSEAIQEVQQLIASADPHRSIKTPDDLKYAIQEFQYEQGLPTTGVPDPHTLALLRAKVSAYLRQHTPHQPTATKSTATNFISKTFGGPPSAPKTKPGGADFGVQEVQRMLNIFFQGHVIEEDGKMGKYTKDAIVQFQQAQKLPATGVVDQKTHDFLVQIATPLTTDPLAQAKQTASVNTRAGASAGDWKSETASLGKAAQNIIAHAMSDQDPKTQASLSNALSAAGFPNASAAVAQKHGVAALPPPSSSQDFGPGF